MKKLILVFIVIFGTFSFVYAQNKFVHGNMKIGDDTYEIMFSSEYPTVSVSNLSKNVKDVPVPDSEVINRLFPIRDEDKYFDVDKEKTLVVEALGDKINKLMGKESIRISYVFYPDGKIMNIEYGLSAQTVITPNEIGKIDENLRNELKMKFTGEQYKAYPAIYFSKKRIFF